MTEVRFLRPQSETSKEMQAIVAEMAAGGDAAIETLLTPTNDDCAVIGRVLQTFAFCDLSARRGLDIIDQVEGKSVPQANQTPRDSQVFQLLAERSAALPISIQEQSALKSAVEMLSQFVNVRHHFAHWAARRHPVYDALVMMSFNRRETSRKLDHTPERFKAAVAVVPMPEVRANLPLIENNANFVSARVTDWYRRFITDD